MGMERGRRNRRKDIRITRTVSLGKEDALQGYRQGMRLVFHGVVAFGPVQPGANQVPESFEFQEPTSRLELPRHCDVTWHAGRCHTKYFAQLPSHSCF